MRRFRFKECQREVERPKADDSQTVQVSEESKRIFDSLFEDDFYIPEEKKQSEDQHPYQGYVDSIMSSIFDPVMDGINKVLDK